MGSQTIVDEPVDSVAAIYKDDTDYNNNIIIIIQVFI